MVICMRQGADLHMDQLMPEPIWILLEQESEWQWHQLGHMQICTSPRQITMLAPDHSGDIGT